ncbi:hypothetical protein AJ78_03666 [Emergomyces pasteurianus Ep9510]|uniref:Zn(2)-C6 fungal-type domain-containing protein n=1 Tax=Emergomyces pasteurianus Ep9510 TaxID=1447872 RepID=A0A1J9PJQ7_9EURO|nr:hypothetical protein AJ78_03666 [Emergomyces pasteurianus Ep9510]
MSHATKITPRSTAPTINRKPHTKSRTGCYNCKARRVKCPETRPICDNCKLRQLDCVYPSQFKSQLHQTTRRLQPNCNGKNYAAAVQFAKSLLPPPMKTVTVPPQFPPFFTIDDMRFFHHYMISAYPYLPYGSDKVWTDEIPLLAHQHEFLFHAILSLGASHFTLVSANHAGPEETPGYAAMLAHRGLALRGLQQTLDRQPQVVHRVEPGCTPANLPELNAMLATCYALTMQAGQMCDGFTDFLVMIRGCGRLTGHISKVCGLDPYALPLNLKNPDLRVRFPHLTLENDDKEAGDDDGRQHQRQHDKRIRRRIDTGVVKRLGDALRGLIPLLQHECHKKYHGFILDAVEALQRQDWIDALDSFQQTYAVLCSMEEETFQNHIIGPVGREADENNAMFMLLFAHFTTLQMIIYPILLRVMPERARYPVLMMPQLRWLIEINVRLPEALHRYMLTPLEIVARVGAEVGVFKSGVGKRVNEDLNGKAEELRHGGLHDEGTAV